MTRRGTYSEGDWFAVPLRPEAYALGIVARANQRKATLLCYFFGPPYGRIPALADTVNLTAGDAVLVGMCGHLGLTSGSWQILGRSREWRRSEWPMPVFGRYEELTGRHFHVFYDDDDPASRPREREVAAQDAAFLPEDGSMGAGFVEARLSRLLGVSR